MKNFYNIKKIKNKNMNKKQVVILAACFFVFTASSYEAENKPDNSWSIFKTVYPGEPEPIGSYANGCMTGASKLAEKGIGYQSVRRNRNRFYGQPELINFIELLGKYIDDKYSEKVLIGDMSMPRGGRMNFGHSSHQVGLDVDIWNQVISKKEKVLKNRDMHTIVNKATGAVIGGVLDKSLRDALYFSATYKDTARIFVNPVIKYNLCNTELDKSWLRKLRPWWGHDEHFHVRLDCPKGAVYCKKQNPIPAGSGCNDSLYNWVDEQSGIATGRIKPKARSKTAKKRKPKVEHTLCKDIKLS